MATKQEERCPYIARRQSGDETYDLCDLNHKACLIEHGLEKCEIWEEIQQEWATELVKVEEE